MADFFDFSTDKINVFMFNLDKSGSMEDDEGNVKKGLRMYQESFKDFPEANSIAVSICMFDESFCSSDFKRVSEFATEAYRTGGGTALYYSIVKGAEHLNNYIANVIEKTECVPRSTYIVFSDGEPFHDRMTEEQAREAISNLNYAGITTVFVAFGSAISSDFGKRLGFMATIDVTDRDTLINFLGVELSKSCKEQSKSLKALGANFFSQAMGNGNSEEYSQITAQVLEDDSWMNDI